MDYNKKFEELIVLLSKICELRNTRTSIFKSFDDILRELVKADVTTEQFKLFLCNLHDRLIKYDAVFRIYAFRAIRHLLTLERIQIMIEQVMTHQACHMPSYILKRSMKNLLRMLTKLMSILTH